MNRVKKIAISTAVIACMFNTCGNVYAESDSKVNDKEVNNISSENWGNTEDKVDIAIKKIIVSNMQYEDIRKAKLQEAKEQSEKDVEEKKKEMEKSREKKKEEEEKKKKEEEEKKKKAAEVDWYIEFYDWFDSSFKSYMDYRAITNTSSIQYDMQHNWGAYTDEKGIRKIGDDYCVALATGITDGCGERFRITLDTGVQFTAIVADVKSDAHTDAYHLYKPISEDKGNVVEFVVDTPELDSSVRFSGSLEAYEEFRGNVVRIEKLVD